MSKSTGQQETHRHQSSLTLEKIQEHQRVYGYRLSRARRTIENGFGILSAKLRIFRRPIKAKEDLVDKITKAA